MADIHYVRQGEPLGLGHAVSVGPQARRRPALRGHARRRHHAREGRRARRHAGGLRALRALGGRPQGGRPPARSPPTAAPRPSRSTSNLVRILDIVEKPAPEDAPSNLAVMGRYVFTPEIFDALDQVKPGKGGEIQLTDAIKILLGRRDGLRVDLHRGPLRRRQQARLPAGHGRVGPRARGPRPAVPGRTSSELARRERRSSGVIPLAEAQARVLAGCGRLARRRGGPRRRPGRGAWPRRWSPPSPSRPSPTRPWTASRCAPPTSPGPAAEQPGPADGDRHPGRRARRRPSPSDRARRCGS